MFQCFSACANCKLYCGPLLQVVQDMFSVLHFSLLTLLELTTMSCGGCFHQQGAVVAVVPSLQKPQWPVVLE